MFHTIIQSSLSSLDKQACWFAIDLLKHQIKNERWISTGKSPNYCPGKDYSEVRETGQISICAIMNYTHKHMTVMQAVLLKSVVFIAVINTQPSQF